MNAIKINKITENLKQVKINSVFHLFEKLHMSEVKRPNGEMELLVGMQHQSMHLVREESTWELGLYSITSALGICSVAKKSCSSWVRF